MPVRLSGLAVVAAVLAAGALLLIDTYSTTTCTPEGCIDGSRTLLEENGAWVLGVLALPILVTITALAAIHFRAPRGLEWTAAGLLILGCLAAIASVGIVFLPAAGLLLAAVAMDGRKG